MSLKSLLYDSSRKAVINASEVIEGSPELFKGMLDLCSEPYPIAMRASRVIQIFCKKYPETIFSYLETLSDELLKTNVDGVKRSFLKIMIDIVEINRIDNSGLIFNKCLDWLFTDKETIAVRAYSIDLLEKFALQEPDLKNELIIVLENLPLDDFPSLKKRRMRCLNQLNNKKYFQKRDI